MKKALVFLTILFLSAARSQAAEPRKAAGGGPHSLRMDALEVRGLREKPDILYLPVPAGIALPSPVRYDLFLEDMTRPILPREILPETSPAGGNSLEGAYLD
jgi:hypothetical protein